VKAAASPLALPNYRVRCCLFTTDLQPGATFFAGFKKNYDIFVTFLLPSFSVSDLMPTSLSPNSLKK
jgi:hypothetical protein